MPRSVGRARGRTDRPRRLYEWSGSFAASTTAIPANSDVLVASATVTEAHTLMRAYLGLLVQTDQVAAAEEATGAVGIGIVSAEAFAIGITALPSPLTSMDFPWWLHGFWGFNIINGVSSNPFSRELETKSARKVTSGEVVVVIVSNGAAGFGAEALTNVRFLSMLS